MNAPLALSLKALSTLSTPAFVLTAALAQMFAPPALSLPANNRSQNQKLNSETAHPLPAAKAVFFVCLRKGGKPAAAEIRKRTLGRTGAADFPPIAYTYIYLNGFRQSQPSFQREQP